MWKINQFLSIFVFGFMCAALLFTGSLIFLLPLIVFSIASAVAVSQWIKTAPPPPDGTSRTET